MDREAKSARWQNIRELFKQAKTQPLAHRERFLLSQVEGDLTLLDEIQQLLAAEPDAESSLEKIVAEATAEAMDD